MFVLGLAGLTGSGKDEVRRILEKKGFNSIGYSEVLRIKAEEMDHPTDRPSLLKLGNKLREDEGKGVLSRIILELFKKRGYERAVAVGPRSDEEEMYLRDNSERYFLTVVEAPAENRYERIRANRRNVEWDSLEGFKDYEKVERELGYDAIEKRADFRIDNSGSKEDLEKQVEEMLERIGL